jgi:hypothetical protein
MLKSARHRTAPMLTSCFIFGVWIALPVCGLLGCDVQKMNSHFQGPTELSGKNVAIGGISYSRGSGVGDWDRQISACRLGDATPGSASIRFGSGPDNLPLTVMRNEMGNLSFALATPDGLVTGNNGAGCTIKLALNPSGGSSASGPRMLDGEARVACAQGGKDVHGSARFERCGYQ